MASKFLNLSTDNTLGGNAPSDYLASSQKAIKEYVDNSAGSYTAGTGLDLTDYKFNIMQEDIGSPEAVTVVGTLTNNDGVYSGFSSSNYITIPTFEVGANDSFEIQLKFSHNTSDTNLGYILADTTNPSYTYGAYLSKYQNQSFWYIQENYVDPKSFYVGLYNWSTNTDYWIKFIRTVSNGTITTETKYSTDGTNWTTGNTASVTGTQYAMSYNFVLGANLRATSYYFKGSIDTNACYIKKNGVDFWNPANNPYKPCAKATTSLYGLVKPDGTSITVNDGVISSHITSSDVTTALGYTPYDSTNPNGYTSNVGTVTSVNNVQPVNGNVTLSIPTQASDIGAQPTLVSGTNIKTINNTSLLGSGDITISSAPDIDGTTITQNTDDELQAVAVIDNRSGNALKTWTGTKAQYDAIVSKDSNTLYNVTDDTDVTLTILETLYPVGSIYITTTNTCPLTTLISGSTWTLASSGIVKAGDIPCKGDGKTLGITDGTTTNYGFFQNPSVGVDTRASAYDVNVGTVINTSTSNPGAGKALGITTDSAKSGIIADTSSLTLAVNIFERTA